MDSGNLTQRWISWGAAGGRYFLGPYSNNGGRVSAGSVGYTASYTDSDAKPAEDTWQYWAFVREGTEARLYVDGNHIETRTVPNRGGAITDAGELRVGRQYGGNLEYLRGRMDDLAIWDEALSWWEINNAMTRGAENYLVPEPSSAMLLFAALLGAFAALRPRRCAVR